MDCHLEKTINQKKKKMNKKIYCLIICFTWLIQSNAQLKPVLFQLKTDTIIKWNYYFGDEFSKSEVNDEKWHMGYPWGGLSILEDEWADPANLKIENGILELYAKKTDELKKFPDWMIDSNAMRKYGKKLIDGKYPLKFTGSAIWSKNPIRYGYFECRCRMPSGKGLWPAFWLYGGNPNDEIDFMELKGEREKEIHVDVHCPDRCDKGYPGFLGIKKNWGAWVKVTSSLNQDWNIISGIWMPGYVLFFVNGDPVAYFKGDFKNSMNVIANLAVAVDNGPFNPGPDDKTSFPAKMEVDYIRAWKVPEDPEFSIRKNPNVDFDRTEKTIQESNSDVPKFKKVKPYMKNKKFMKKEMGFISFYPVNNKKYLITNNSSSNLSVIIKNSKGEKIKEQIITKTYTPFDLNDFKGKIIVEVRYLNNKSSFTLELP